MMATVVKNVDGHEAEVVDTGDLLRAERYLRNWILATFGGLLLTIVGAVVVVERMRSHLEDVDREIVRLEVRDGAVGQLTTDVAVIRTQQDAMTKQLDEQRTTLASIMDLLAKGRR